MEEVSQSHSTDFKTWGQNQTLTFQGISKIKEKNMIVSEKKKKDIGHRQESIEIWSGLTAGPHTLSAPLADRSKK